MIDNTIEYKSIIMGCDKMNTLAYKNVPNGYNIKYYTSGDEKQWVNIHESIGEFVGYSTEDVDNYFKINFMSDVKKLESGCIFIVEKSTGIYVGCCMAWFEKKDEMTIPVLHWLAIRDGYENQGLARVLITETMKIFDNLYPEGIRIYLHTQPGSYKAIKLYHDFGFCMLRQDQYDKAINEYDEALLELKKYMFSDVYSELIKTSKD